MKAFITPSYTFTPGASGVGTIDLSGISSFDVKRLVAIINQTSGVIIYSTASEALKYTSEAAGVVTLNYDTSLMDAGDALQIVYEEPNDDVYGKTEEVRAEVEAVGTDTSTMVTSLAGIETGIGAPADAAKTDSSQSGSVIAWLKGVIVFQGIIGNTLSSIETLATAISGKLPGSLGAKPMANSLSVALASDQTLTTVETALTITFQEITNLTTSAQTFTAPTGAKWMLIEADDTNVANVRVKIGGTATTSSGIQFQPGRSEMIKGGGDISVIAESGSNQKVAVQFGA